MTPALSGAEGSVRLVLNNPRPVASVVLWVLVCHYDIIIIFLLIF